MTTGDMSDGSRKGADKFDDRAVARGLEVFQSTMPPELPPDDLGELRVLMHAGTAKTAQQLEVKLGPGSRVLWDDKASRGSIDSLMILGRDVSTLQSRTVALIDARWMADDQLEQWHQSFPLVPIVLIARDDGMQTLRALAAGVARGCLMPSCSVEQLAQAIDKVSRGELCMPPVIVPYLYACMLAHTASIREAGDPSMPSTPSTANASEAAPQPSLELLNDAALTPRELAAIELARTGFTNKEIAKSLGISDNTVKKHLANAFDKLGIHRRRQLY